MRIGMVTACYHPVINGVTRMITLYAQDLQAAGHQVTVFTFGTADPSLDEPNVIRSPGLPLGRTGYFAGLRYTASAQRKLREMDIIHCHHLFMSVELAHRYGRCPIVYTNHTRYDLYASAYLHLPQFAADAIMRHFWPARTRLCDVVISPTPGLRDVMRRFGVSRPIEVIENGIELAPFRDSRVPERRQDFRLPSGAVLAIYVGRLAAEKRVKPLLVEFVDALRQVPGLHLLFVGDGPEKDDLFRLAAELGAAAHVHFAGPVGYDQVPNYLAAADLFVTASTSEVHPLTVMEALAAGRPVVAVGSPGISETVRHQVTGLLVAPEPGALAAGLMALAQDRDRRQQMSQAARQDSPRFSIERTVEKTVALYEALMLERGTGQRAKTASRTVPVAGRPAAKGRTHRS